MSGWTGHDEGDKPKKLTLCQSSQYYIKSIVLDFAKNAIEIRPPPGWRRSVVPSVGIEPTSIP